MATSKLAMPFWCIYMCTSVGYVLKSGTAVLQGMHMFSFSGCCQFFSKVIVQIYTPPSSMRVPVAISLSTLSIVSLLNFRHSGKCVVVSHCDIFYFILFITFG